MEPIRFAVLGLGVGALYALVAHGIVLIYRGSGTLNFAQGAFGLVGAWGFYELHLEHGWSWPLALPVALLLAGSVGLLTDRIVLHRLRNTSAVARVIATLGVLVLVEALITKRTGDSVRLVPSLLPSNVVEILPGVRVGLDRLALIGIALVTTALLSLVYRRTRFGLATSAVAEDEHALAALGRSPNLVAAANWTVGAMLAGLAGILIAPITGLAPRELVLLVIPALAAALVGSFRSFWLTLGGALLIGVIEAEAVRYVTQPGVGKAAPFLLIVLLMSVRGRGLPLRGERSERGARLGEGGISPLRLAPLVLVGFVVVANLPSRWLDPATTTLLMALACLSLVVVTGYTGQLSLAQLTLAGVGALGAAQLSRVFDLPFAVAVLAAALVTLPVGLLVALPALRTRGANLAVATLGLSVVIERLLLANPSYTGGIGGLKVDQPKLLGVGIGAVAHPNRYALVVLTLFVLTALAVANLRRGRAGRRLVAVRANERSAAALGISVLGAKLYAFGLGAVIAGLAGGVAAFRFERADLTPYTLLGSIHLVVESTIGGIGFVGGAILGGASARGGLGNEVITTVIGPAWHQVIAGALVLVVLMIHPNGAFDGVVEALRRLGGRGRSPEGPLVGAELDLAPGAVLHAQDLTVRFGTIAALTGVSFIARPGEVLGLIGPNGAGKTTLIDAVSGYVRSNGLVELDGNPLTNLAPHRRARAGLGRTFQSLELFEDLTIRENLRTASESRGRAAYITDLVWPRNPPLSGLAVAAVKEFGLVEDLDCKPDRLPAGRRRLVAIARAVASRPSVLLLDEPAAGLDEEETVELGRLIRRLAHEWGMTVLVVEHDIALVKATCDRVIALDFGEVIAEGEPSVVLADPHVVAAYLGEQDDHAGRPSGSAPSRVPAVGVEAS